MTDLEKEDVTDVFSELATGVPDAAWDRILPFVNQFDLTECDSDDDRALARIYLAAHLAKGVKLSVGSTSSATAGPVTSESVGGIRRSYGFVAATATDSALNTTRYGQMFLEVLRMTGCRGPRLV
jgi:hypothetical protein